MATRYDRIGTTYAARRRPDPRIAARIAGALGPARRVLNVGAGTGSYEPDDRDVTAVEPSSEMIRKRPPGSARVVQASAEALPFEDGAFDAAMAVLTVHHWTDKAAGLAEMRRVTRGPVVILTYDPGHEAFWLFDYFPGIPFLDSATMPELADFETWLGPVSVSAVPVPHDCRDGFLGAYWRRPEAYLDPEVRAGMSCFWAIGGAAEGLRRLEADLESGAWAGKYGAVLELDALDVGYRLVVA